VQPIRVLVSKLSRFRRDVVRRSLTPYPDIVFVGDEISDDALLSGRAAEIADVVLVGADADRLPAECGLLLYARPGLRLLVMEEEGGGAVLYELRPRKVLLGDVSAASLADAIRGEAVGDRAARDV
jgi:hypothetical protein